jgi:hypothetical protein
MDAGCDAFLSRTQIVKNRKPASGILSGMSSAGFHQVEFTGFNPHARQV